MKKNILFLSIIFIFIYNFILVNIVYSQTISAKVIELTGDVTYKLDKEKEWKPLSVGMELVEGTYIMTSLDSTCKLEFLDKSILEIKELSKVQISKFMLEAKKVDTNVSLFNGKIKANVHREANLKTEFQVKTPVSTISVRGTEKEVSYHPGFGTMVNNIHGIVEVTNLLGQKQTILKGESTSVTKAYKLPDPIFKKNLDSKTKLTKNLSLSESEEEFKSNLTLPTSEYVKDMLRDLSEIAREKEYHPLTDVIIKW